MNKVVLAAILALLVFAVAGGCKSSWGSAGLGAVGGAAATSGGYEYNANQEMKRIDQDLKDGKMTQQEHDIRKDEIKRMSLLSK
jgi:hypothetical protein